MTASEPEPFAQIEHVRCHINTFLASLHPDTRLAGGKVEMRLRPKVVRGAAALRMTITIDLLDPSR